MGVFTSTVIVNCMQLVASQENSCQVKAVSKALLAPQSCTNEGKRGEKVKSKREKAGLRVQLDGYDFIGAPADTKREKVGLGVQLDGYNFTGGASRLWFQGAPAVTASAPYSSHSRHTFIPSKEAIWQRNPEFLGYTCCTLQFQYYFNIVQF